MRTRPDTMPRRIQRPGMFTSGDGSTLSLDFTSGVLDPRFTFTRSTTATFINSQGYVQFANANLMTYSNPRQTGAAWLTAGTVTWGSSTLTDPTGGSAAQSITFGTTGSAVFNTSGTTVVSGITHTFSVWMRSATGTTNVRIGDANVGVVATVTLTTTWQRFSCQYTTSGTNDGGAIYSQTGTPSAEFYVWGAQVQPGSIVGELIQTSGTINTNTPRFDYDPTTLTARGLLIEGSASNLMTYSEDQGNNTTWSAFGTSVTRTTGQTDPGNNSTASKLVFDATTADAVISRSVTVSNATQYTISMWMRADSGTVTNVRFARSAGSAGAIFPTLTTSWQRVQLTFTSSTTSDGIEIRVLNSGSPKTATVHLWGAQLEAGSGASSYISTVASIVQRATDSCVLSGTNFSSWFNATQGTLLTTWSGTGTTSGRYATINDGSASNQIWTGYSESAIFNGSFQASFGSAVTSNGKVALAYATNDAAWCLNNGSVSTDTSVTLPTGLNQIAIGNSQAGTAAINTSLRSIKYFPSRLPNATLQSLTT